MNNTETAQIVGSLSKGFDNMNVTELALAYLLTTDQAYPVEFRSSLYNAVVTYAGNTNMTSLVNAEIASIAKDRGIQL